MKKSQAALEFMFAIGIAFFVFLMLFGFMLNRKIELQSSEERIDKEKNCLLVSSLMTSAFIIGDGAVINASIGYDAMIDSSVEPADIDIGGRYCPLAGYDTPNAELSEGDVMIRNTNGYIEIENV